MNGSRKGLFLLKTFLIMMETSSLSRSFSDKYGCQTSFLEYYQIISAIPNRLLTKAKDTATKEFYFNFMYRIIVTNRELLKFGINEDDECIYCGQNDFTDHTLIMHALLREDICKRRFPMVQRNKRQITPATEEKSFGVISNSYDRKTNEEI